MSFKKSLERVIELEESVPLMDDAIIHKATQENAEFFEEVQAIREGSTEKVDALIDELGDAITNTLSSTQRILGEIPQSFDAVSTTDPLSLMIMHGKWNDALQSYRKIYTRSTKVVSKESVLDLTQQYISGVLAIGKKYTNELNIDNIIKNSIVKMEGRMDMYKKISDYKTFIKDVPNFPKPGIMFKDIAPLLAEPNAFAAIIEQLSIAVKDADTILALDARGFLFGGAVAYVTGKKLTIARKPGKLPTTDPDNDLNTVTYGLEYKAEQHLSTQKYTYSPGEKVAVIDDLLATGGSALAGDSLALKDGAEIEGHYFAIELGYTGGRKKIEAEGRKVVSLVTYEE